MAEIEVTTDQKEIDVYKQQFEEYSNWSRFYHDAEIKVNATALAISSLAPFAEKLLGESALVLDFSRFQLNLVGLIIIVASAAAIFSTLGYWRYYEFCDIYAREYRKHYIPESVRSDIKKRVHKIFDENYRVLDWISDDAHHVVWILVQSILLLVGIYVTFAQS